MKIQLQQVIAEHIVELHRMGTLQAKDTSFLPSVIYLWELYSLFSNIVKP